MELLQELNPDVLGDYCDNNPETILKDHPNFFKLYDVVIATSLKEKTIIELSNKLWNLNIPFIYCRSIGFMGSVRIQIQEHYVIETHPDNKQNDIRLDNPFPALKTYLEVKEFKKTYKFYIFFFFL